MSRVADRFLAMDLRDGADGDRPHLIETTDLKTTDLKTTDIETIDPRRGRHA
jgi:hypothetical protein